MQMRRADATKATLRRFGTGVMTDLCRSILRDLDKICLKEKRIGSSIDVCVIAD